MTKSLGFAFVALLAWAHVDGPRGDAWPRPLSMFRDCEPAWLGYALFGLLTAVGLSAARTAWRVRAGLDVLVYLAAAGLLAVVATTPSFDADHTFCALALMTLVFLFFAARLFAGDSFGWMLLHLFVPSGMIFVSAGGGYGLWQKGVILYFVSAILLHEHVLGEALRAPSRFKRRRVIVIGRRTAGELTVPRPDVVA